MNANTSASMELNLTWSWLGIVFNFVLSQHRINQPTNNQTYRRSSHTNLKGCTHKLFGLSTTINLGSLRVRDTFLFQSSALTIDLPFVHHVSSSSSIVTILLCFPVDWNRLILTSTVITSIFLSCSFPSLSVIVVSLPDVWCSISLSPLHTYSSLPYK